MPLRAHYHYGDTCNYPFIPTYCRLGGCRGRPAPFPLSSRYTRKPSPAQCCLLVEGETAAEATYVGVIARVTVIPDGSPQVAHELGGHTSGAGDQYVGGTAADGSRVTVPGPGRNVMQNYEGHANEQTLREVIQGSRNINRCDEGVTAINHKC